MNQLEEQIYFLEYDILQLKNEINNLTDLKEDFEEEDDPDGLLASALENVILLQKQLIEKKKKISLDN